MNLKTAATLLFLGCNAWKDLRRREIYIGLVILYGAAGLLCGIMEKRSLMEWMISLSVGVLFAAMGVLSRGAIGMGDGWIILSLGCFLSMDLFMKTVMIGILSAALCSGLLLTIGRKNRHTEIPFVPFLFLGCIGGMFL